MLCEKCGTENKDGVAFCKNCGEDLFAIKESEDKNIKNEMGEAVENANGQEARAIAMENGRVRTSPLAVRMQEKSIKEDKKIKKKLKRGKVWAAIAIILAVMFVAENAALILKGLGYITLEEPVTEEENVVEEVVHTEPLTLGSKALSGQWEYTYKLKKNWDSDSSGDYETITEIIESNGQIALVDKGDNHMAAIVIPDKMLVDGGEIVIGETPEAFSAWYEDGNIGFQFKGTEQKFFASGGNEPLTVKIPVSMDEKGVISGGTYTHTYDKVVTEMNMRYEIEITLNR